LRTPSTETRGAPSHVTAEGGSGSSTRGAHADAPASGCPLDAPELDAVPLLLLVAPLLDPPLDEVDAPELSPPPDPHAATNPMPTAESHRMKDRTISIGLAPQAFVNMCSLH
jgi:hypothetical protein